MYFVYMYENTTMAAVEIVVRSGVRMRKNEGERNLIRVHHKHIWKGHNETPEQLIYANRKWQGRIFEGSEETKVGHTHGGHALGCTFERQLEY
jgi:hypothetical protein